MRFDMNYGKPISISLASHFKISSSLCPGIYEENDNMSRVAYVNAIGSLMYVMVSTWLEISQAKGVVSRYMENLGKEH